MQVEWDTESLSKLQLASDKTVADQVALTVGELGENIAVRRAAYIQAPNHNLLGYYVHVAGMKKYSSLHLIVQAKCLCYINYIFQIFPYKSQYIIVFRNRAKLLDQKTIILNVSTKDIS